MATPAETRDQLIKDLRATRTCLMSPEWLTMIQEAPKQQQQAAAERLMKVQLALLKLENEALESFRDALIANEAAIAQSSQKLRTTLDRLQSVSKVLAALKDFLGLVARILPLL